MDNFMGICIELIDCFLFYLDFILMGIENDWWVLLFCVVVFGFEIDI